MVNILPISEKKEKPVGAKAYELEKEKMKQEDTEKVWLCKI